MRKLFSLIIIGVLFFSCSKQGQQTHAQTTLKNMEPRITIEKNGIQIRNSTDTVAYANYEIIVNEIYNARLLRKPEINIGNSLIVPYELFRLPIGAVIESITFKMPNYVDYTITRELEPHGDLLGFLDIQWGSNIQTARRVLEQRGNSNVRVWDPAQPFPGDTAEENRHKALYYANQMMIYSEGEFAGYGYSPFLTKINLYFYKEKFYRAEVDIAYATQNHFEPLYNLLSGRYWETIITTLYEISNEVYPMYTWLFDNNCYIRLTDETMDGKFRGIKINYVEKETYDEVRKIHLDIINRESQERRERANADL